METPRRIPVQDFFRIKTPSMTVTITAEDLLIPPLCGPIPVPGNLVIIDPNPRRMTRSPPATEAASLKVEAPPVSPSVGAVSTEAPTHRPRTGAAAEDGSRRRESSESSGDSLWSPAVIRRESSDSVVTAPRRSSSKHADAIYGKMGAPPPIQRLEEDVSEERTPEGMMLTLDKESETKDFTYWDKLRRRGTRTEIRRWRTYVPEGEEETAFFGRAVGVDVPIDAYGQGIYFKQEQEDLGTKEYKLPTRSYVAPPVWIRRAKGVLVCDITPHCPAHLSILQGGGWQCKCDFDWNGNDHSDTSSVAVQN